MPEQAYKRCARCGESKPLDDFNRDRAKSDGRCGCCRPCHSQRTAEWKRANPDRKAATNRRWRAKNPERMQASRVRAEARNPERARARANLRNAVYEGKVAKPNRCEDCGEQFEKHRLQGHHADYSKFYDVDWLCHACHVKRHHP
jgi:hypothetical protein